MPLEQKGTSKEFKLVKGGKFHWYIYIATLLIAGYSTEIWIGFRSILLEETLAQFPSNQEKTVFFFILCFGLVGFAVLITEIIFFIWGKIAEVKSAWIRTFLSDFLTAIYICVIFLFVFMELGDIPLYFFKKGYFSISFFRLNESLTTLFGLVPASLIVFYTFKFKKKEFIRIRTKIFFEQTDEN